MKFDPDFIFQPSLISNQDGKPSLIPTITILELLQSVMRAFPNPKLSNEEVSIRGYDLRILKNQIERGNQPLPSDYKMMLDIIYQTGYKLFQNPLGFELYQQNINEYLEALRDNDEETYNKCVEYEKQFHQTDEQKEEMRLKYEEMKAEFENKKLEEEKKEEVIVKDETVVEDETINDVKEALNV